MGPRVHLGLVSSIASAWVMVIDKADKSDLASKDCFANPNTV